VQAEVKKAEAEVRVSRRREEKARKTKAELEDQLVELELDIGASERQKREELKRKEEWLVQHDLLRLDVQNMQRSLTKRTDEVFSLENKRQQLILSMEERCQEIDIHKDLLRSQLKSVREETHDVLMDLGDRQRQVEKLKAKFQTLPGMAGEEGVSQAEYIIRAAQQREELQRRGDTLDQEIRGKEREIRALQTTLDHLDARNDAFRQSFQRADMSSEEADQMKKLEEKSRTAKDLLFRKRKDLQRIASDLRDDQMRLHQMQEQHQLLEDQKHQLLEEVGQESEEVRVSDLLLEKMGGRIERAWEKLRTKTGAGDVLSLKEKSVRIRSLQNGVTNILFTLSQLSREFPEMQDAFFRLVSEASLQIPNKPSSMPPPPPVSSSSVSIASSLEEDGSMR
jgi:chromosome segregation ATPase